VNHPNQNQGRMAMDQENRPVILIIDDEEIIRNACHKVLSQEGFQVELASDGIAGLKKAREIQPDLAIIDLKMPGLPGPEVLDELTRIDPFMAKAVITGYATIDTAVDCMQRGASYFLMKPFIPDELKFITKKALEKREKLIKQEFQRDDKKTGQVPIASIIFQEMALPLKEMEQFFSLLETRGVIGGEMVGPFLRAKDQLDTLNKVTRKWLT